MFTGYIFTIVVLGNSGMYISKFKLLPMFSLSIISIWPPYICIGYCSYFQYKALYHAPKYVYQPESDTDTLGHDTGPDTENKSNNLYIFLTKTAFKVEFQIAIAC